MVLTVNNYCFLKQRQEINVCSGQVLYSLLGTDNILKYCLDVSRLQRAKGKKQPAAAIILARSC
jgi:hypothetical protein